MGAAEVPPISSSPEKRGLADRLTAASQRNDGNRVTGTPWVASPFLRWGALGVAFICFSALLGYSALPSASDVQAAPSLSFFAVYLTDDPLPDGLDGLVVSIARVGAGDPSDARSLDLRVKTFDLSKHQGVDDALPVATGYVVAADRDRVFIEFEAAVGLRGEEEVPLEVTERYLHVEYQAGLGDSARSAVLLDIDLEQSVQEVDVGAERVLRFVPTVADVYSEPLPSSVETVPVGEPIPSSEPLFASAVPKPPIKQYRTAAAPVAAPATYVPGITGAADPLGVVDEDASRSSTASSPRTTSSSPSGSYPSESATTTDLNRPPQTVHSPWPANGRDDVETDTLSWLGGEDEDGQVVSYEVFLSTMDPPPLTQPSCTTYEHECRANLQTSTTYFWRVRADDGQGGVTLGDVWSFRTDETMCDRIGFETACPV